MSINGGDFGVVSSKRFRHAHPHPRQRRQLVDDLRESSARRGERTTARQP